VTKPITDIAEARSHLMPAPHDTAVQGRNSDPFIGAAMVYLFVLAAAVLSLAAGITWRGLLHWTGELLLILGILLAAKGISDVRREWTMRPGIWGYVENVRGRAASMLWARWNRVVRWTWLARHLHLRAHGKVVSGQAVLSGEGTMTVSATAHVSFNAAPANATTEERLAWLETRIVEAGRQLGTLNTWHEQEVRDRQAATQEERAARMAEDQRIRDRMADLAGGGLRLQAWGVVCLLLGTILTAFW
jgi:hypothetical protein